jgi:hypothetical protein
MRLFEFDKASYEVHPSEESLTLTPFKKIITRDKSKDKGLALKELAYVWFFADITSPYMGIIDEQERTDEIKKDTDLPKAWKPDAPIKEAVEFYRERSKTIVHALYDSAMIAASAINEVFRDAKNLINDSKDKIEATQKVIQALEKVPKVMANLREAEKELIRLIEDKEGKKIGSKTFAVFEEGLDID